MPKVFLSAGHSSSDPGAVAHGTTEHQEVRFAVEMVGQQFSATGEEILIVPSNLSLTQKISWINSRANINDFAFEIHLDSASATATGSSVWYEDGKNEEKSVAEYFAPVFAERLGLNNRGAKPDTTNRHGRLGFVRDTTCHAWLFEAGFVSNINDLKQFREKGISAIFETVVDLFLAGNVLLDPQKSWPFRDVFPSHFFFSAVQKAKKKGILSANPLFRPEDPISRGEIMSLLERLSLLG